MDREWRQRGEDYTTRSYDSSANQILLDKEEYNMLVHKGI